MKKTLDRHKNSAVIMFISAAICIWSGINKKMSLHKFTAALMFISGIICMYSGHKLVHPTNKQAETIKTDETKVVTEPPKDQTASEN